MRNFETEKQKLIDELEKLSLESPNNQNYLRLKEKLRNMSAEHLDGGISHLVTDQFDYSNPIGEKLIEFESFFTNKVNLLQSEELRNLAKYLQRKGAQITFFGAAWSNSKGNWIYFDIKLDLGKLKKQFSLSSDIMEHVNNDPKSGTEAGFIDNRTGEALIGLL